MAEGLGKGTGGGAAGSAAEIAMGFGLAQQMMNQPGGMFAPQATPPAGGAPVAVGAGGPPPLPGAAALPELLSPADVAKLLSVTEEDVVSTLTDGSLKGKKIGSTWRITRASLDEFLRS
jgi:excisionase family DNA binding protein